MTKKGFLNAVSVGFSPLKQHPRYDDDGKYLGILFEEQELLELSLVPIPANANALQVAKSFNFSQQDIAKLFAADPGTRQVVRARDELELLKLRHSNY
jgi:phage head maturation protease